MSARRRARAGLLGLLLLASALPIPAHEGHDHGEPEPAAITGTVWPRAAGRSEAVEVVLVLTDHGGVLYLDDARSNAPIAGATVSVSGDGLSDAAWQEASPAVYTADLALPAGRHALTVAVEAGEVFDLLPLTLELTEVPRTAAPARGPRWLWVPLGLGLAALVAGLLWRRRRRQARLAVLWLGLLLAAGAAAHGEADHDHEHDAAPAPASGAGPGAVPLESPRRLGETQVFVPKSVQRLWGLRTLGLRREPLAAQAEWPGRVIADPAASSHLEAPEAGHARPGPAGWPRIGQTVAAGEVLLHWQPRRAALDEERLRAERERLGLARRQAEARRDRLRHLEGFIAARELIEAEAELASLRADAAALSRGLAEQPLRAPVAGVLIEVAVSAGETLEAGAPLLRIADPARLIVEALAPDASLGALAPDAHARWPAREDVALALRLIDGGGAFRGQRVPWRFALVEPPAGLLVGQPLRVRVRGAGEQVGLTLPRAALLAGEDAAPTAWVHVAPEVFESRRLAVAPLDAGRVTLLRGASAGERVVVQAAVLLGQVR